MPPLPHPPHTHLARSLFFGSLKCTYLFSRFPRAVPWCILESQVPRFPGSPPCPFSLLTAYVASPRPVLGVCAGVLTAVRDPVRVFNGELESTSGGGVISHGRESAGDSVYLEVVLAYLLIEVSVLISPLLCLAAYFHPLPHTLFHLAVRSL